MAERKIGTGDRVIITTLWWNNGKRGVVINEHPAQLGEDLVEIMFNDGTCVCIEREHLRIAE